MKLTVMADIEELKKQRSTLKAKISTSASRLKRSIDRKLTPLMINGFYTELETHYLDFSMIDLDYNKEIEKDKSLADKYAIVNQLNLSQYTEAVESVYVEARGEYDVYLECLQNEKNATIVRGISDNIHALSSRLDVVMIRVSSLISEEEADETELLVDKEELETLSAQLLSYLDRVVEYPDADWTAVTGQIQDKIVLSDEKRRQVNITLKKKSTSKVPTEVRVTASGESFVVPVTSGQTPSSLHLVIVSQATTSSTSSLPPSTSSPSVTASLSSMVQTSSNPPTQCTSTPPIMSTGMVCSSSGQFQGFLPIPPSLSTVGPSAFPTEAVGSGHWNNPSYNPYSQVKVKRAELPTFSGLREDWAEFKTLWPHLALPAFHCKEILALELRRCLLGKVAKDQVMNVPIIGPESFEVMWNKLCLYYDDPAASVNAAMKRLESLPSIKEEDYRGLSDFVDVVEGCYSQLTTIDQKHCLTLRDVDNISARLPLSLKHTWARKYQRLETSEQVHPFPSFMNFLGEERSVVARLVEQSLGVKKRENFSSHHTEGDSMSKYRKCAIHTSDEGRHITADCKIFQELSRQQKLEALRSIGACFRCFGKHLRSSCRSSEPCGICSNTGHHVLLCRESSDGDSKDGDQ